ncbi:MAG: PH domain-containing protein, partial [Actinomycetota bacterium]
MSTLPDHSESGSDADSDQWQRLHPATILSDLVRRLPQVLIGVLLILNSSGGNQLIDTLQLVIGVFAIAPVIVRYVTARYCVDDSLLRWREGLLRRQTVDVPRARIQSVDSRVDLIGRQHATARRRPTVQPALDRRERHRVGRDQPRVGQVGSPEDLDPPG